VRSESWRNKEKYAKKDKKDKKEKEGKQKKKRGPTVCEVTEVSAVPKKEMLKLCKVVIHPGTDPVEIVTSAPNVSAGHKFIAAPPGYTTANGVEVKASRVAGLESAGMFCGPKEMGWDTDILDGDLAIMLDSAEVGSPAPSYEEAVAAFQQREEAKQKKEEEAKAAATAKDDKKKNGKKGKAAEDEDLDELLAEFHAADGFDAALQECKPVAADAAQEDRADDETVNAKTLANRKKKEKRKAKQQEKTGGEGIQTAAAEEEQAESQQPASSSSKDEAPAAAAKKGAQKELAHVVKAARERVEHQKKLAEEKRAFDEAERCRVEEEQRQIDEEERKEEEERERKRERKAARIAKQKAEGTYLTKKQRDQAKRAAQVREQLGYRMAEEESLEVLEAETAAESDDHKDSSHSRDSDSSSSSTPLRAPVITVMGHPDAGKTTTQDKMRGTNVQEGEAGGITQQLGATFLPDTALEEQTKKVDEHFDLEVPGLLIMDTPGHASFDNLRRRGSSLADLAIVVVDIMKGLEPQTVESLNLLKERDCQFIVALNKIDRLYNWKCQTDTGIQEALDRQDSNVRDQFTKRVSAVILQLNEQGLNCNLYWEHKTLSDLQTCVSLVPMSAFTGEGIPDLLYLTLKLAQNFMSDKLEVKEELECSVMEVKHVEGLGTAIDVLLLNGTLKQGDTIVLAGSRGPIVTTIRALLTPQPMKDIRVKNEYLQHKEIKTSMSVKISAPRLEDAMPGTQVLVQGPDDDLEELKEEVSGGFECILNGFEKEPAGVYVKASTLGSLEALLSFLQDMKIPVFDVGESVKFAKRTSQRLAS